MLQFKYIFWKEFFMNKSMNIFRTTVILTLCFLAFFIFSSSSVLADEVTSTADTEKNSEDIETNLPPETILATFGDKTITLGEFNELWEQVPEDYKLQLDKSMVLDQMISEALLIQEAKVKNFEEDEKVAEQIKKSTEQILVQALIQKDILDKVLVSDEEVEKYYETNKDNFTEKEQVHLFNILVKTEEEAQAILEQLKAGEDFSEIAKTKSTGPSAAQGGDMELISKGSTIPEIDEAVFALNIGELTDIIKSDYGFHILKVTEKKPESIKTLEEVKDEIMQTLLPEKQKDAFDNLLTELKSKVEIEINDEALK
jgi:peptidyl-prolyl cis-trans isomerase C